VDVEEARSHQNVDWLAYYQSIAQECPWSLKAYQQGQISTLHWVESQTIPALGTLAARVWIVDYPSSIIEAMAEELNSRDTDCEWLFSYPGYGEYATPVPVLIQQNRLILANLRQKIASKQNPI
jgi:hypothetical protein